MQAKKPVKEKIKHPLVTVERGWKDYLGECLLIVFSVLLALVLTEYFNSLHEKKQAHQILHQLREELIENRKSATEQYAYHLQVFKKIDSAKTNAVFAKRFLDSGEVHINVLMPHGAIYKDLNEVAWQQAKQNDVFKYLDFSTYSLLTDIYNNQERYLNFEPSLASLLINYQSRDAANLQTTLTLIRDVLYAWIVERTPRLINQYQKAINILNKY